MRRTLLAVATWACITVAVLAAPTKAEARCWGCWAGAGFAASVIGGALIRHGAYANGYYGGYGYGSPYYGANNAYGYVPDNYGYAPTYSYPASAYYGGEDQTYYTPYYYQPRRMYGYAPYRRYYRGYYAQRHAYVRPYYGRRW